MPIISADSWRVETEDRRLWCELRLEGGTGLGCVAEVGLGEGEEMIAGESTAGVLALAGKEKREKSFTVVGFKEKEEIEVLREWDRR